MNKNEMHIPKEYEHPPKKVHSGPVLALIILALLIILGGLYLWGSSLSKEDVLFEPPTVNNEPETPRAIADLQILETVSSSDEIGAIEADIMSTNLDGLDTEMSLVEAELEAALR